MRRIPLLQEDRHPDSGAVAELQPAYKGDRCGGVLPGAKQTTEVLSLSVEGVKRCAKGKDV